MDLNGSSAYLGQTKGFLLGEDTWREALTTYTWDFNSLKLRDILIPKLLFVFLFKKKTQLYIIKNKNF